MKRPAEDVAMRDGTDWRIIVDVYGRWLDDYAGENSLENSTGVE